MSSMLSWFTGYFIWWLLRTACNLDVAGACRNVVQCGMS